MSRALGAIESTVDAFVEKAVYYIPRNFSPDGYFPLPDLGDCATLSFELLHKLQVVGLQDFFTICLWSTPDLFKNYGKTGVDAYHVCISVLSDKEIKGIIDPIFRVNRLFTPYPWRNTLQKSPNDQLILFDGKYTWLHVLSPGQIRGYDWSDYYTNPLEALRKAGQMARTYFIH